MKATNAFLLIVAALLAQCSSYKWRNEDPDSAEQVAVPQLMPPPIYQTGVSSPSFSELPGLRSSAENLNICPTKVCGVQPFDENTGLLSGSLIQICKCPGYLRCQQYAMSFFLRSYKTYVCAPSYTISRDTKSSTTHHLEDL